MNEYITIADDPFSLDLWKFLEKRVAAAAEFLSPDCPTDPLKTKYAEWWMNMKLSTGRTPPDPTTHIRMVNNYKVLTLSAATNYLPDEWKKDSRNFDPSRGQGEITVNIGHDGTLLLFDGNHRAAALRAAGKPVGARVHKRHDRWARTIEAQGKALHQPYPHPDLVGIPVVRRSHERYDVISDALKKHGIVNVIELGACLGCGTATMAGHGLNVVGVEYHRDRYYMGKCLIDKLKTPADIVCVDVHKMPITPRDNHAMVGLAVWHHLARTLADLDKLIASMVAMRVQVVELPTPEETRWHAQFLTEAKIAAKEAPAFLLARMKNNGGYKNEELIFTDTKYANRETVVLSR